MPMMVKPTAPVKPPIRLISGDLMAVYDDEQLSQIGNAVRKVLYGSQSKYKPTNQQKVKKPKNKNKTAKKKDHVSSNLPKVKPVLEGNVIDTSDDERYAMWWSFHTDFTKGEYPNYKGVKVHSIDASNRDKAMAQRKTRMSKVSKNAISNRKALGMTPRAHTRLPNLIGSVPHMSDETVYQKVTEANKIYEKELIARYCIGASIARVLPLVYKDLETLTEQRPVVYVDPWLTYISEDLRSEITAWEITRASTHIRGTEQVNVTQDMINKLEALITADSNKQVLVPLVTAEISNRDDSLLKAEANVFDIDLSEYLQYKHPTAANDPLIVSETLIEKDQWCTPEERLMYFATPGRTIHTDEVAYCYALRDMKEVSLSEYNVPMGVHDKDVYYREEGFRLLHWLRKHDSSWLRHNTEVARKEADQSYLMNFGEQTHPLYHVGEKMFANVVKALQRGRIRAFDNGTMNNLSAGEWYRLTKMSRVLPEMITNQIHKEELAKKLVDNVIAQQHYDNQISFRQWSYMIEAQHIKDTPKTTTVSEISPTVARPTAEIVELSVVRDGRAKDMEDLLKLIKPKLSNLTEEQKEGARLAINALTEALG